MSSDGHFPIPSSRKQRKKLRVVESDGGDSADENHIMPFPKKRSDSSDNNIPSPESKRQAIKR